MPDKKPQKHVHFLPPLGVVAPINSSKFLQKNKKFSEKLPTLSTALHEKTPEEQANINAKAKKAAFLRFDFLLEHYRKRGASMESFAREIGISANIHYAKFLIEKNPQAKNIIDEIAIGFYVGGHKELFRKFCEEYHASFEVFYTRNHENRYSQSRVDFRYDILMHRLQTAYKEAYGKNFQKIMDTEFSSDDSFVLSP